MLPRENRLRAPADFRTAFRTGVKGTSSHVLAHVAHTRESHAPRVGFVVSKAVGNAVVRNRVKRRARAWAAGQLKDLRTGDLLVIRALPAASDADYAALTRSLDRALRTARRRLRKRDEETTGISGAESGAGDRTEQSAGASDALR
ncbi:MAG: ribonuclease P protein component [Brevibacterium yomogidense]|uniref:ribonuclease P protein component n=1 Tax=Brevibacterium sp. Mu109 TaxID=1255669 RepID=UPI000C52A139|nr:ribonuclease P protein component [Brevibacterium sp. Mu109]SMX82491.1 ribonuclease P protein component [Brevibacterium sp. Mu109]